MAVSRRRLLVSHAGCALLPTIFEFTINLKAAKALGTTIPAPGLARATEHNQ